MIDALRIGWTQAEVARRRRTYRLLLGAVLLLHAALGIVGLAWPGLLFKPPVVPGHLVTDWVRLGGLLLVAMTLFYLPGWIEPLRYRGQNLVGVVTLVALALLLLCLGRTWIAIGLAELLLAGLLALSYGRLTRAELMSLPGPAAS
jgi:hypothetical protein